MGPFGRIIATAGILTTLGVGIWTTTQPADGGACSTADATGCSENAGRTLTITDVNPANSQGVAYFVCNGSLLTETHPDASVTGSGWPVKIVITPDEPVDNNGFSIDPGCDGDGDPDTIDLVLEIAGDGETHGFGIDAMKVRQNVAPTNGLQVTGSVQCGEPSPGETHQDGIQLQGGTGIEFYDFEIGGDWETRTTTCQGAGGGIFLSGASGFDADDMRFERVRAMGCHWGFNSNENYPNPGTIIDLRARGGEPNPTLCSSPDRGCGAQTPVDGTFQSYVKTPLYSVTNLRCDAYPYDPAFD